MLTKVNKKTKEKPILVNNNILYQKLLVVVGGGHKMTAFHYAYTGWKIFLLVWLSIFASKHSHFAVRFDTKPTIEWEQIHRKESGK